MVIYFRGLASIMVLSESCPYPDFFTSREWDAVIQTNPYKVQQPIVPPSISSALQDAARKHVFGEDSYLGAETSELSRAAACIFNDL
jgi:hypothetical protein